MSTIIPLQILGIFGVVITGWGINFHLPRHQLPQVHRLVHQHQQLARQVQLVPQPVLVQVRQQQDKNGRHTYEYTDR